MGLIALVAVAIYAIVTLVAFNPNNGTQRGNAKARDLHCQIGKLIVVFGLLTATAGVMELEDTPVPNIVTWIGSLTTFFPLLA